MEGTRVAEDPARRLARVRDGVSHMEGRRRQLREDEAALRRRVGLAKGRIKMKPDADRELEQLHADAQAKTVGFYEQVLTAISGDVVPQDGMSVGLDLYNQGGLPALDIFGWTGKHRVSLMEQEAGSLLNTVCLGLRAIGTVKGGGRRFLALDEPDCYVKDTRARGFFNVMKQMARKMRFQTVVVSHNDLSLFDGDVNLVELRREAGGGISATVRDGGAAWPDDAAEGIRAIVLRNFAAIDDVTIPLSPGMNVIIGDNRIGKSRVMRFLRSVAYGASDDNDIRHGCTRAEGEIHVENGRVIHWSRELKRNPVVEVRLVEADGRVASVDGKNCEGAYKAAIPWLSKVLGIPNDDELQMHVAHQLRPVFLLDETNTTRAKVLSIGQESGYIRKMMTLHRDGCARDAVTVKTGEIEMGGILARLSALDAVDSFLPALEAAGTALAAAAEASERGRVASEILGRLERATGELARGRALQATLAGLAEPPGIDGDIARADAAMDAVAALAARRASLGANLSEAAVLSGLPEDLPSLDLSDDVAVAARAIRDLRRDVLATAAHAEVLRPLADGLPTLLDTGAAGQAADIISRAASQLAVADGMAAVLGRLPAAPPELPEDEATPAATVARLAGLRDALAEARRDASAAAEAVAEAAEAAMDAWSELGDICPTCGGVADHAHVLETHSGEGDRAWTA